MKCLHYKQLLRKHNFDASHNYLHKMDPDFSGYLEYLTIEGERTAIVRVVNGRPVRKYAGKGASAPKQQRPVLKSGGMMAPMGWEYECMEICEEIWGEMCFPALDPDDPDGWDCYDQLIDITCYEECDWVEYPDDPEDPEDPNCWTMSGFDLATFSDCDEEGPDYGGLTEVAYAELIVLENDYKSRMTSEELSIYNTMTLVKKFAYLTNAKQAEMTAENLFPTSLYNGKGDAFRHAFFHALNSFSIGEGLSEALGNAHEAGTPPGLILEKEMDLFNNAVGRAYLTEAEPGQSPEEYVTEALENGELRYLAPLASGGYIIPGVTQLIPANN